VIQNAEKLACIVRELKYHRWVYPRRISEGKMTPAKADNEIKVMEAITEDYQKLVERERLL
jgi:hypothetical protein